MSDSSCQTIINTVIHGDCLEVMKNIPDNSIDMILCDLPYGITANKWDEVLPIDRLWEQYERVIKDKGNIILFGTGLFAFKLALSNEKLFRYDMVWKKSKCGSPLTAKYMPLKKHEMVLVFGKPASKYNPQMIKGTPYKRKPRQYKTNNMKYGLKYMMSNNKGERHPTTVLDFPQKWRRQDQIHPTQKPVPLFEWLIKSYTNEGDTVLDNCIGSGTTAVACINTNRNFIGIELDKNYHRIAVDRISKTVRPLTNYDSSHTTKKPFPRDEDWEEGITN